MSIIYTTLEKINIAKVSQYYCLSAIRKAGLFADGIDIDLPRKIYLVRKNVEFMYDISPSNSTLFATSTFLLGLCAPYNMLAANTINAGNSGTISPINPSGVQQYPIYITQANFETATLYPNTNIFGTNIIIYYNQIQRYLIPNVDFEVLSTGVNITMEGFDASQYDCNLVIEKFYN